MVGASPTMTEERFAVLSKPPGVFAAGYVFSNQQKRRKTARMMLNRLTIDLRISGPAFRAL